MCLYTTHLLVRTTKSKRPEGFLTCFQVKNHLRLGFEKKTWGGVTRSSPCTPRRWNLCPSSSFFYKRIRSLRSFSRCVSLFDRPVRPSVYKSFRRLSFPFVASLSSLCRLFVASSSRFSSSRFSFSRFFSSSSCFLVLFHVSFSFCSFSRERKGEKKRREEEEILRLLVQIISLTRLLFQ